MRIDIIDLALPDTPIWRDNGNYPVSGRRVEIYGLTITGYSN